MSTLWACGRLSISSTAALKSGGARVTTSVPVEKLVDAAGELNANAILASTIISHDNVHYKNMKRINELAVEKGIRDRVIIAAGGTQVIPDEAVKTGIDQGFGRDSHGIDVATFLAEEAMRRRGEL